MNRVHVQEIEERAVIGGVEVAKKTVIAASDEGWDYATWILVTYYRIVARDADFEGVNPNALNVRGYRFLDLKIYFIYK